MKPHPSRCSEAFLAHRPAAAKMLFLTGEDPTTKEELTEVPLSPLPYSRSLPVPKVPRRIRALTAEFRGKIHFAVAFNTTERQRLMEKEHLGTSIEYNGWTCLFYQNSETPPKEFDAMHIAALGHILHICRKLCRG